MSDGPHRSLPMPSYWKPVAERAATPVYVPADVEEALSLALKKDFLREAPVSEVALILRGDGQGYLFPEAQADQLEALRDAQPGSVAAGSLIDCALQALSDGPRGDEAAQSAVTHALQAHARSRSRQIVEHYHRVGRNSPDPSDRLHAARDRLSYTQVASELLSDKREVREPRLTKRSGVDEGPPL